MSSSNLDSRYPALAALARENGRNLPSLAGAVPAANKYIHLNGCLYMVSNSWPRHGAPDAYNYLATVDALSGRLTNRRTRERLWTKLVGSTSAFLDTVAEAAWALHFWDKGIPAVLEEPFNPLDPQSKDADVTVVVNATKCWLDVVNAEVRGPRAFERVAERKYRDKFRAAVRSGPLQGASVGVLVCILKSEEAIVPFLAGYLFSLEPRFAARLDRAEVSSALVEEFQCHDVALAPPIHVHIHQAGSNWTIVDANTGYYVRGRDQMLNVYLAGYSPTVVSRLFARCPGLDLILIHTLRPESCSDMLRPLLVLPPWTRNLRQTGVFDCLPFER